MDDDVKKKVAEQSLREVETAIDELRKLRGKAPVFEASIDQSVTPEPPFCSFCGKGENQVKRMLQGRNAYICNQCVTICQEIISGS